MCGKEDIRDNFAKHLTRPYALQGPLHTPQSFQTVRKKGSKDRDLDLTVFYWPFKNGLPFNQTASNMFKMQIYGDVLLVQQTREPCFLPRDRYVNYTLLAFNEQFAVLFTCRRLSLQLCNGNSGRAQLYTAHISPGHERSTKDNPP